jgi:5-methylcytosine-specific restriction endonuclease McrA
MTEAQLKAKQRFLDSFQDAVFKRDHNKCAHCGSADGITFFLISPRGEMPNGGYVLENAVTLCHDCYKRAKYFYGKMPDNAWRYPDHDPRELYKLIGSDFDMALEASLKLKLPWRD